MTLSKREESRLYHINQDTRQKERSFDQIFRNWKYITRANNPSKNLSEKARKVLSNLYKMLITNEDDVIFIRHKLLSSITERQTQQNTRYLSELKDIFNIEYYQSVTIGDTDHLYGYVISFTDDGYSRIINPESFYNVSTVKNTSKKASQATEKEVMRHQKRVHITPKKGAIKDNNKDIINISRSIDRESFLTNSLQTTEQITNIEHTEPIDLLESKDNVIAITPDNVKPIGRQALKDFYPLTEEEAEDLRTRSGRPFTLNAMNEILKDMSSKCRETFFLNKTAFLNYFARCLREELRDAVKTSQSTFRIQNNMDMKEKEENSREKFFAEIEDCTSTTDDNMFKKRIIASLPPEVAYKFLTAYISGEREGNIFKIVLRQEIELTEEYKERILNKAHEIYGATLDPEKHIKTLNIVALNKSSGTRNKPLKITENNDKYANLPLFSKILELMGKEYDIGKVKAWLNNIQIHEEDNKIELCGEQYCLQHFRYGGNFSRIIAFADDVGAELWLVEYNKILGTTKKELLYNYDR